MDATAILLIIVAIIIVIIILMWIFTGGLASYYAYDYYVKNEGKHKLE
jgi:hypothetical protein